MVVLKNFRQRRGHERFAQADDIADEHAVALVEMVRGNFDGGDLVIKQAISEFRRDTKFRQSGARLLRQMIGHLDVNIIWRKRDFARPAFFDDLHQLGGNVHAPFVVPRSSNHLVEFLRGVMVKHIHVQFALIRQAGKSEIAAAEITDDRADRGRDGSTGKVWREVYGGGKV